MARRPTDVEQIEAIFNRNSKEACLVMRERIDLQMRTRFNDLAPAKRGRPKTPKGKPPIAAQEVTA